MMVGDEWVHFISVIKIKWLLKSSLSLSYSSALCLTFLAYISLNLTILDPNNFYSACKYSKIPTLFFRNSPHIILNIMLAHMSSGLALANALASAELGLVSHTPKSFS